MRTQAINARRNYKIYFQEYLGTTREGIEERESYGDKQLLNFTVTSTDSELVQRTPGRKNYDEFLIIIPDKDKPSGLDVDSKLWVNDSEDYEITSFTPSPLGTFWRLRAERL